jgi:HSP20 family protein
MLTSASSILRLKKGVEVMSTSVTETGLEKRPEQELTQAERTRSGRFYRPNVDILERADELTVSADMPGVRSEDIDINFENGLLTIHGRVQPRHREGNYLLCEYGIGDFYRTFQVGEAIDSGRISAEYRDGVLTLHLPKVDEVKPRKIAVQSG